jgi:hypothetical protein
MASREKLEEASKIKTDDEEWKLTLKSWEKRIDNAEYWGEYRDFPQTKDIANYLIAFIKRIDQNLLLPERLLLEKKLCRDELIGDKNRCKWLLKIFLKDYKKQLTAIESEIERSISEVEE